MTEEDLVAGTAAESHTVPGRAEVARLARDYDAIPVHTELSADTLTPVEVFATLCRPDATGFLLENADTAGTDGHSYIGYRPAVVDTGEGDPLVAVRQALSERVAPIPGIPPFHGGAVGYLGWESARHFERLPRPVHDGTGMPEAMFFLTDTLAVVDHAKDRLLLITLHRPLRETYAEAVGRLTDMRERLRQPCRLPELRPRKRRASIHPEDEGWRSNVGAKEFERRVRRAQQYILAGDAFQVVLSQRFSKRLEADPLDLYRTLRTVNRSPYMYHLRLGGERHIVGASPELLVRVRGGKVRTKPLAGTRPRGTDSDSDRHLEQELLSDPKERAEHVMLVDLGRNDIGRVARPGSVGVDEMMAVEHFSHVMHLSSTVSGDLADTADTFDVARAVFPAGTLSGAPKIRAMEIIAEMEGTRRGVYGGAVGYLGVDGDADLAIGLRTITISQGMAHVQAGAGVVADSDPASEYWETVHKAAAMVTAVREAETLC